MANMAVGAGLPAQRSALLSYSDVEFITVFSWAVIHDRPISWTCRPLADHHRNRHLPSGSTMSRLRSASVVALLAAVERRAGEARTGCSAASRCQSAAP